MEWKKEQPANDENHFKLSRNLIIGVIILAIIVSSVYTITAGYRGVLLTFGKPDMIVKGEGIHIKLPFIQSIIKMDVRTQKYEAELTAASKDLQDVNTKIAINYKIIPEMVPAIYQGVGIDYAEKIIYPLEQETNKAITSMYTAEELILKREEVREKMKNTLIEKLRPRNVIVEEISIIDFEFSQAFTLAIEQKVTMEQNALAAKNKLEQIKYEAQQKIAEAGGDAEKIKLIDEQLRKSPSYVEWLKVNKWDGKLPTVTAGMPFIDVTPKPIN